MNIDIDTEHMFDTNKDFRDYVEKYIFKHHITLEEALKHQMVINYALYLKGDHRDENHLPTETIINCGC